MRCSRWFLLSSVTGALACSDAAPPPDPGTALVAQCAPGEEGPQCPRNGQTGSLGMGYPYFVRYPYGVGLGCPSEVTELDWQADTGLGFHAQALVELVSGTHRESLLWLAGTAGAGTSASPTSTQLSVEIQVIGSAQLLTREQEAVVPPNAPPGAVPGARCLPSVVGLPVRVRLQSEDGALDATIEATLESSTGDFARLAFVLPAAESLSSSSEPDLAVELSVTRLGVMGSLSLYSPRPPSDGSSEVTLSPVAHFPALRYCTPPARSSVGYNYTSQLYLAPDQEFRGISIDNQLALLNRASPVSAHLRGDNTSRRPLSLSFANRDDHLCLDLELDLESRGCSPGLAKIPATVRMSTADGEVNGELPVELYVVGGSNPGISVNSYRSVTTLDEVPALLEGAGIHAAVDYSGQSSAAVLFSALLEGEDFQASLTVIGQRDCGDECTAISPIWLLDWGGPPYPYEEDFCGAPRPARG